MTSTQDRSKPAEPVVCVDGFEVLDACHVQTLHTLDKLAGLVARLAGGGADAEARSMAAEIVQFFSTTARQHHEDEERHVFPKMATSGDSELVRTVLRLQQDHDWLEEDWMVLSPQIDAVAYGLAWFDLDTLRDGAAAFTALMRDHIALEESCIYPQARGRLRVGERREMGREMAARRHAERKAKAAPDAPDEPL
jgi:hemerythrin-like domain-containing protein